jgi:hypothetical protein
MFDPGTVLEPANASGHAGCPLASEFPKKRCGAPTFLQATGLQARIAAAFFLSVYGAADSPQRWQLGFQIARVRFALTIRSCEKRLQVELNTNRRSRAPRSCLL